MMTLASIAKSLTDSLQLATAPVAVSFTIEAPTGYLGSEFTSFYVLNANCTLSPLSDGPGEQSLPVVMTSADASVAMGAWSPGLPQPAFPGAGYGRWKFPSSDAASATNKWSVVHRTGAVTAGTVLTYDTHIAVGTLQQVWSALCQVRR